MQRSKRNTTATASVVRWDPGDHPAFLLSRAARSFSQASDERLAAVGVTNAYVPVLRGLHDGVAKTQTELAELVGVEQPTMALMLRRMERDGLVRRARHPTDRRSVLFSLTPRAVAKIPAVRAVLVRGADELLAGFSRADVEHLRALLVRAVDNVRRPRR